MGLSGRFFSFPVGWGTARMAHLLCFFPLKIIICVQLQGSRGSPGGENSREAPPGPLPSAGTRGAELGEPAAARCAAGPGARRQGGRQWLVGAAGRAAFRGCGGSGSTWAPAPQLRAEVTGVVWGRPGAFGVQF